MQGSDTATVAAVIVGAVVIAALVLLVLRRRGRSATADADDEPMGDVPDVSPVLAALLETSTPPTRRLRVPPRAEQAGRAPGPGVMSIAGVDLPTGRPTRPVDAAVVELAVGSGDERADGRGPDQLWIASRPASDATTRWKQLAAGFGETGLWPLLLPAPLVSGSDGEWFDQPARRDELDERDPAASLRDRLVESLSGGSPLASTERIAASNVAAGRLGRGSGRRVDALAVAFEQVGSGRLALAPGRRPADVLHSLAWPGADAAGIPTLELANIIGSWEERYGVLLVSIDVGSILLAVLRPPADEAEAIEALAEQHALCPDEAADWGDDLQGARELVDNPVWRLSWH